MLCFASVVMPTSIACLCDGVALALLYAFMVAALALEARHCHGLTKTKPAALHASELPHHASELTQLRGAITLQTVFCILAVDFPLFPRAGAKTPTFGRSVMDLGVGAAVLAGALTRRRDRQAALRVLVRHAPLFLAGIGRILVVRSMPQPSFQA